MYPFGPLPEKKPTDPEQIEEATIGDLTDIELIASDKTLQWRAMVLAENGFTPHQSRALALDRNVDIRWVINRLIKRGCDRDVAFDIAS